MGLFDKFKKKENNHGQNPTQNSDTIKLSLFAIIQMHQKFIVQKFHCINGVFSFNKNNIVLTVKIYRHSYTPFSTIAYLLKNKSV